MKFFIAEGLSKKVISVIFILKLFFGLALWAIYTYHYTYRGTSDAFRFYDDAVIISNSTKGNYSHYLQLLFGINSGAEYLKPYLVDTQQWYKQYDYGLFNDSHTLIRFNMIVLWFSFGSYHVHTVFMNFISLIGLVALYKTLVQILPERKIEVLLAVFFIPTVLFWGSGVLKEGLMIFAFGLFILSFYKIISKNISIINCTIFLFSFLLLLIIKTYIIICLVPSVISILFIKITSQKMIMLKFLGVHLLMILFALNIYRVFPDYDVLEMISIKQRDFYGVADIWKAGSVIDIGRLEPNLWSFIKYAPQALATTFFRPHLLESHSSFLFASAIENFLLLMILLFYLFYLKLPEKENLKWVFLCVSFVVFLALLIGWTTPIMGAVVRYKLPLLPFLIFILLFITKKSQLFLCVEKWTKKFSSTAKQSYL